MFWLYNLDLHNLDIEGKASFIPDPRSSIRWNDIAIVKDTLDDKEKMSFNEIEELSEEIDSLSITGHKPKFKCQICNSGYNMEGYLKRHIEEKHNEAKQIFDCPECEKKLTSKRNLENHIVNFHRTCKQCKPSKSFSTKEELISHKSIHTYCKECDTDMKTKYKLERHMKTHQT